MKKALLVGLLSLAPWGIAAGESPEFRGNPEQPGIYAAKPLEEFTQVKWKFTTKGPVAGSPAVVGETLYVGSSDHRMYAIDLANGTQKWKFLAGAGIASSPAVADGLVYFGCYDGNFYALDATTGKLRWKFKTGGEHRFTATHLHGMQPVGEAMPDPFDVYLSSPVVWKDAVYFGSGDGNVYAVNAANGELKWKFHTGDVVHASPAIRGGVLYIGSWDSYFYALDAASGAQKWKFKTGEDPDIHNQVGIQSSAVVADGMVYFGCRDSNLYALDAATGEKKWAFNNKGSWVVASPTVKDGKLYFATSDSGMFHAVNAKTGELLYSLKFSGWPTFSSPMIAGDKLYVGSNSGNLYAIDLAKQAKAWEFATDGQKQNGATYTKADGTPNYEEAFKSDFYDDMVAGMREMMTVGSIFGSPVLVNGVLYFASADGNVYALV